MRLVLLGTTGYHPCDRRETACLLLPECGVMLDAGTGMYRATRYLETSELDVFLTHAHLDHVVGLTYLFDILFVHPLARVTVHAEADKIAAIEQHLFAEALFPKRPPAEFQVLSGEVPLVHGGRLRCFPLEHPGGTVGYRLDWPGHSMAYVTDTVARPDAAYIEQIRGVDLLVHECYFSDEQAQWARTTGHSFTTAVAQLARQAEVRRLLLVHINPLASGDDPIGLEIARAIFPETVLGQDLMEVEF
jgi:ribonuclease BN (tRNA processing enzyme)